VIAAAIAG